MGAVFRMLLYLYPQRHRELLGAEMQAVFEQGAEEHRLPAGTLFRREAREISWHPTDCTHRHLDAYIERKFNAELAWASHGG
jgi:hypothetical protein